jgi:diguanylate cyclase (GGDEF)-like protein
MGEEDRLGAWRRNIAEEGGGSIATRIILVVFLATFLTALLVSGIAIHATYVFLQEREAEILPVAAHDAADRLGGWLDERMLDTVLAVSSGNTRGLMSEDGVWEMPGERALARLPADAPIGVHAVPTPDGSVLLAKLAGPDGAVLLQMRADPFADALGPAALLPDARHRIRAASSIAKPTLGGLGAYRSGDLWWVGSASPVPGHALEIVVEAPFRVLYAPVFGVVTRVALANILALAIFAVVAYRVTTAITRPLEALSKGARQISRGELDLELSVEEGNDEIALLNRTFNDMARELRRNHEEIGSAQARLEEQNEKLRSANEVLEQLSVTDGLTQLHNHRYFQDHLTREIKRVTRTGEPLSMLLLDIDDFKALNDRRGHAAGDELLNRLARILLDVSRETDLVARYGGEEFAVIAPNTGLEGALLIGEKMRMAVAETPFLLDDSLALARITISVGAARFEGSRRAFFQAADQALYRAKAAGKNCVVLADEA